MTLNMLLILYYPHFDLNSLEEEDKEENYV